MAQEKARLQERKKLLLEEIQFSNTVLEQTKKEKDLSIHQSYLSGAVPCSIFCKLNLAKIEIKNCQFLKF